MTSPSRAAADMPAASATASASAPNLAAAPALTSVPAPTPAPTVPVVAVVLAAGSSTRFNSDRPKQLVPIAKREMVDWAVRAFNRNDSVTDIVVVTNPAVRAEITAIIERENYGKVRMILDGGRLRIDSIEAALEALGETGIPSDAKILVHDAARPFVSQREICECVEMLDACAAAVVAAPLHITAATTQHVEGRRVIASVNRPETAVELCSPQAFRFGIGAQAYREAAAGAERSEGFEIGAIKKYLPEESIALVEGSEWNVAILTAHDMPRAEEIAKEEALAAVREMIGSANFSAQGTVGSAGETPVVSGDGTGN